LKKISIFIFILISSVLSGAIKPEYGGEVTIRLNEPSSFSYSASSYSNSIFFSLIYENFFYLDEDNEISSNLFSSFSYDSDKKLVTLKLKKNLSFSDGTPITPDSLKFSLKIFLTKEMIVSNRFRRAIKSMKSDSDSLFIQLNYNQPKILYDLSAPELVLLSMNEKSFSGIFIPERWERGKFINLKPNLFYPGGRSYLRRVKIVFYDFFYPDIFLSERNLKKDNYREINGGIFQNYYLSFPYGKTGKNTKIALFSLFRSFFSNLNFSALNSLTSEDESPISMNIKKFSSRKIISILRYSKITVYATSSLKKHENDLNKFLNKYKRLNITFNYIEDNQIRDFLGSNRNIRFFLSQKFFMKRTNIVFKLKKILNELVFSRMNEKYLTMIKELQEISMLKNNEFLMDRYSKDVTSIISNGLVLPLNQENYSLYLKKNIVNVKLDYYGRPIFRKIKLK